jgi:hypothetical protein
VILGTIRLAEICEAGALVRRFPEIGPAWDAIDRGDVGVAKDVYLDLWLSVLLKENGTDR